MSSTPNPQAPVQRPISEFFKAVSFIPPKDQTSTKPLLVTIRQ
jgi:hypothetical protein